MNINSVIVPFLLMMYLDAFLDMQKRMDVKLGFLKVPSESKFQSQSS